MIERLKRIMSIHRYYEVCLYLKSKQDIGLFHDYNADTIALDTGNIAALVEIKGVTSKMWRKVLRPELQRMLDQPESNPHITDPERVRYHVQIMTEEP